MDDENGELMEPMEEVPLVGLYESELERLVHSWQREDEGRNIIINAVLSRHRVHREDDVHWEKKDTIVRNFAKCLPILKILSLLDSAVHLQYSHLKIPPRLDHVATLPCEIAMFKKSPCSKSKCSEMPCKTATQKNYQNICLVKYATK